ncbi:protein-L-isoaspartate O-methyltransferase family protein [Lysobacter sp. CA196]|uniref:protein-L-isoaspartate O-methyltransferase family protein n=1 Tax=Lysobacter sp. CA196 TaxID=3455606 RepID=UPI003F8D7A5D
MDSIAPAPTWDGFVDSLQRQRGMPYTPALQTALTRCPRHRFVKRFKVRGGDWLENHGEWSREAAALIFSDRALALVETDDGIFSSAQSTPSFILDLLERLQIAPNDRVLEIGSASGWLLALMSCLAPSSSLIAGTEIIPSLVESSNAALFEAGFGDTKVYQCGGLPDALSEAEFDVIVSTSASAVPQWLAGRWAEGGRCALAMAIPGGGDYTAIFVRERSIGRAIFGRYTLSVPGVDSISAPVLRKRISKDELLAAAKHHPLGELLATARENQLSSYFLRLRHYLSVSAPDFCLFDIHHPGSGSSVSFGIHDERDASFALLTGQGVYGGGGLGACSRLLAAMDRWEQAMRRGASLLPKLELMSDGLGSGALSSRVVWELSA